MGAQWISERVLIEAVGEQAAMVLLRERASRPFYIRKKAPNPDLVALIGAEAALALTVAFGGSDVLLPTARTRPEPRKKRVAELLEAGESVRDVAGVTGVSVRFVSEVKRDLGLTKPIKRRARSKRSVVVDMLKAGRAKADIAKACGCSPAYIQGVYRALQTEVRA